MLEAPKMAIKLLLCLLLIFSLLPLSSALPSESISDATQILSNSGFLSIALTLEFGFQTLISESLSLTIFIPPDTVFAKSGQPSLSLLQLHFSPLYFSLQTLKYLPNGTKIPTLSHNRSLIVTSSSYDDDVSINGLKIDGSPLYDDGSLVIFKIDQFFDLNFKTSSPNQGPSSRNLECTALMNGGLVGSSDGYSLKGASQALKSRGYSVMASFLDMQVGSVADQALLTIFAPIDVSLKGYFSQFDEYYPSLFLSHAVPCKIMWSDLVSLDNGVQFPTYVEGFKINFTRSGYNLRLNGVPIIARDMYSSNWLVVHGLGGILAVPERTREVATRSLSGFGGNNEQTGRNLFVLFALWLVVFAIPLSA